MAATHGGPPRKKMSTYGKAGRRKVPDHSFIPMATKSQTTEAQSGALYLSKLPDSFPGKTNASPHRSRPTTPLSASCPIVKPDIFDVPSSDEETDNIKTIPLARGKPRATASKISKRPSPKQAQTERSESVEDMKSRKRAKLSPAPNASENVAPAKIPSLAPTKSAPAKTSYLAPTKSVPSTSAPTKPSPPTHGSQKSLAATNAKQRPQGVGHVSTIAARPKPKAQEDIPNISHTLKAASMNSSGTVPDRDSPPEIIDLEMMDVDVDETPKPKKTSPGGMKMWKGLLEVTGDEENLEGVGSESSPQNKMGSQASRPNVSTNSKINRIVQSRAPPRRRLIDSLVEQKIESESEEEDPSEEEPSETANDDDLLNVTLDTLGSQNSNLEEPMAPSVVSGSQNSQSQATGARVTYSRQRSMLAEEDLMQELALDMPVVASGSQGRKHRRGSIPKMPQLPSFHEDADEGEGSGAAIRNVHELRQAGANSRFMDEVDDLLDRIGSPGGTQASLRRSGLLDMANQLKDKSFARQFRSNHVEQRLFVHLGQETDILAGYVLVSILMTVMADGSVPPFVVQLRRQGITRLLIRLLDIQIGIIALAKDRKSNTTKIAQKMIADHHNHLLKLPIWEDLQPELLSPRTVALKCLEVMVRQTREAGNANDIFSKELTTNLFTIVKTSSEDSAWQLPNGREAIDFHLALSALESHSIRARTVQDETIWLTNYLPIISDTLLFALSRPLDSFGVLQILALRLTLNVTNNNPRATDLFARQDLMAAMGNVITAKLEQISRFMIEEELSIAVDHLVLVLGAMINFAEWSPAARQRLQSLGGLNQDHLDAMIKTFTENHERMSEASSVEESQKNVAFGYLSVLLGYLSLMPEIALRVKEKQPSKTITPLVASIVEFISHHKTVDLIIADEDGHNPNSGFTERLESLVETLRQ
ncbi:hypothetical protein GLAREA_07055 [Glarea lozoyensis ATCC 20868]|uniref:Wings apart-like protein C-terminal domain-containing protein n=1 Tax=Glarea lozoyensis (strain ATCC 20868 / MF5171) TaxID=1116229 RepID=S3D6C3_GLAL2|nr:uncharacterized protein GLAREA_07055 [Glarea lozoyensis ATCC 20868]EPE34042.1 hypothetical protein GLAREA_07055 [Glarea lozoyensis ATCC 20868]